MESGDGSVENICRTHMKTLVLILRNRLKLVMKFLLVTYCSFHEMGIEIEFPEAMAMQG